MSATAIPPPTAAAVCADCGKPLAAGNRGAVCPACLWAGPDEEDAAIPAAPAGGLALRIPGHDVEAEIARGGMGIVYRAWEREADRRVALKMLLPHLADEEGMRERFRLEARAAAALDHPAVLPVYHIGVADEVPYFTMKLADGGSLLERRGRYAGKWREIASLVASLAEAVHFAHAHGVLHRDLKPGNILFDDRDRPYLSDFGLVKIVDSESQLTRSRHFLGTPHYSAPEVAAASASEATVASDVWSLGAVLYELLAGRVPFDAEGIPSLLRRIVDEPAPPLPPEVPRDLAVICLKCLQKLPRQRFASAGDLAADLLRWLEGRSISARPMSRTERAWAWSRRNPALAGLGTGLLAALVITAAALWRENSANVRALNEARNAETVSRRAETAARNAQAASLLEEARAIRRSGRLIDRENAIQAVLRSRALVPSTASRDELTALLTMPHLEPVRTLPYKRPWSPAVSDGVKHMVTAEGTSILVRDAATGDVVWQPRANPLTGFRPGPLSYDGRFLAVKEEGRTVIHQQGKDEPIVVLPPLRGDSRFSADGTFFAAGGYAHPPHLVDLTVNPPKVRTLLPADTGWYPAGFSPDHKLLALYQNHGFALRLLDTATGETVLQCTPGRQGGGNGLLAFQSLCWSSRGDYFVAGLRDGSVVRWSPRDPLPAWTIPVHTAPVDALAIMADDRLLISLGRDGQVRFLDLLTLETLGSAPWQGITINASLDRRLVALDRADTSRIELFSCEAPASSECGLMPPSRDQNAQASIRMTPQVHAWPDGSRFAASSGTDVAVFGSDSVRVLLEHALIGRINDFAVDFPSGRWLKRELDRISVYPPVRLPVDDVEDGVFTRMAEACMSYDPVSRRIVLGHRAGFNLYNFAASGTSLVPKRESVAPWKLASEVDLAVSAVAWSPDGKWMAWAGVDNRAVPAGTVGALPRGVPSLHVFDVLHGGKERLAVVLPAAPHRVAFLGGPELLAVADASSVMLYDLSAGRERWRRPHRRSDWAPAQIAAARASTVLAATLDPHQVSLLDPSTGEPLLTMTQSQERTIQAMDITPDGKRLLALAGNLVQLWRLDLLQKEVEERLAASVAP